MSPSMMDNRPRFANSNLSVFRQNAADDSDGASVSSSGSLKRRRRPNKPSDGKRSLLTGSALGSQAELGTYGMARTPSQGSYEGQAGFYDDDDDSSDEQFNVRNGIQQLNLQKSTKTSGEFLNNFFLPSRIFLFSFLH